MPLAVSLWPCVTPVLWTAAPIGAGADLVVGVVPLPTLGSSVVADVPAAAERIVIDAAVVVAAVVVRVAGLVSLPAAVLGAEVKAAEAGTVPPPLPPPPFERDVSTPLCVPDVAVILMAVVVAVVVER